MAVEGVIHWRAKSFNCKFTPRPCRDSEGKLLPISRRNPWQEKCSQQVVLKERLWVLARSVLLCNWHLDNPSASQRTWCFHGLVPIHNWHLFPLKAKSREPQGDCLHEWEADLLEQVSSADVDGSNAVPSTFVQGLAVPLQCVGCMQSPTCIKILWSGFECRSLQPAAGCGCYFFLLQFCLERVRGLLSLLLPSLSALSFGYFFSPILWMAVQAFCLSDGEELLSILYSQE